MKIKFWKKSSRLTLKGWAALDTLKKKIDEAIEAKDFTAIPEYMFQILDLCGVKVKRDKFWMDVVQTYNEVLEANQPTKKFPILYSEEKSKPMPWEYEGRAWYFWLHLLAKNYGWSEEKIAGMDIDDAIGLYQEIQIDEQMTQEFTYSLSEVAYPYNASTKKSNFRPLPRPDWMVKVAGKPQAPAKKVKMLKAMLPQGNVIDLEQS